MLKKYYHRSLPWSLVLSSLFIFIAGTHANAATPPDNRPIAATTAGKIRGYVENGINAFKGIPYGDDMKRHRFLPPVSPTPWNGIRDAIQFGPIAPQQPLRDFKISSMSEDCLNLNVWTPALRDSAKRPVMVWFHGGAYSTGTSNLNVNDGVRLCKRGNVVVVTVNHRLNVLGYLYLAKVGGSKFAESGNVGMLDLVLALKWVRDNISEFGGDPNNVTIFGQSGGGAKCATLMAMPSARGLFHRVIAESGQQVTGRKQEAATSTAMAVLKNLQLTPDRISELQTIPLEQLMKACRGFYFGPVTDGNILPRDPFDPDASPLSADISVMMGNTHDETATLIGGGDSTTFSLTWEQLPQKLEQHIKQFLGDLDPNNIIAKYRQWYPKYSASDAFFSITTAARSWRSLIIEAERRAEQGGAPTYVYQFDWKSPVDNGKWRAGHATEIPFVFDNVGYGASTVGTSAESQKMADMMSEVWIAFARSGNPHTSFIPQWPPFNLKNRPTMIFDLVPRIENDPRGEERILFNQVNYVQPGTL
ncbi:MAG: carboxylesterase/lipase family protein [Bacteroidota bacterium]